MPVFLVVTSVSLAPQSNRCCDQIFFCLSRLLLVRCAVAFLVIRRLIDVIGATNQGLDRDHSAGASSSNLFLMRLIGVERLYALASTHRDHAARIAPRAQIYGKSGRCPLGQV